MASGVPKRPRRIGDIAVRAILILAGTAVALVLAPPYRTANGRFDVVCDRRIGWRGLPNLNKTIDIEGYIHPVEHNSSGMHDTNHPWHKPTSDSVSSFVGEM